MNSRSATAAPARYASAMPCPSAPAGFVVRCHSAALHRRQQRRARRDGAPVGHDPRAASTGRPQAHDLLALGHADARMRALARPYSRDLLSRRRARMEDAGDGMARPPARLGLELDAEVDDVDDTRRRLLGQSADRARPTQAAPRTGCPRRAARGVPRPRGRGDPALSQIAGRRRRAGPWRSTGRPLRRLRTGPRTALQLRCRR